VVADWSKDSKAVLFHSKRNGRWAIFKQDIDAQTSETLVAGSENYFWPRLSAHGALLSSATSSPDRWQSGDTTIRLMSTPEQGGARSTLMMGRDDYACGSSPTSSCVGSEIKDGNLIFFHLDPVKGRGEEIARLAGYRSPQGLWGLSPDGGRLAIVDRDKEKGEIRILNLTDRTVTRPPSATGNGHPCGRSAGLRTGKSGLRSQDPVPRLRFLRSTRMATRGSYKKCLSGRLGWAPWCPHRMVDTWPLPRECTDMM